MTLRSGVAGCLLSRWLLAELVRQKGDVLLRRFSCVFEEQSVVVVVCILRSVYEGP